MLVFGGSLGARSINEAAVRAFADAPYRILHVAGRRDFATLTAPGPHYVLRDYVVPFGLALAAADLSVARAGGSVFELAQYGLPSLLIPYPHASGNHQEANARWMERAGRRDRAARRRAEPRAAARGGRRAGVGCRRAAPRWRPPRRASRGPTPRARSRARCWPPPAEVPTDRPEASCARLDQPLMNGNEV